jgi:haloalkane dehalogenase
MTIHSDIALPQVKALNSTMAYREAGDSEAPVVLFLHGNPTSGPDQVSASALAPTLMR